MKNAKLNIKLPMKMTQKKSNLKLALKNKNQFKMEKMSSGLKTAMNNANGRESWVHFSSSKSMPSTAGSQYAMMTEGHEEGGSMTMDMGHHRKTFSCDAYCQSSYFYNQHRRVQSEQTLDYENISLLDEFSKLAISRFDNNKSSNNNLVLKVLKNTS